MLLILMDYSAQDESNESGEDFAKELDKVSEGEEEKEEEVKPKKKVGYLCPPMWDSRLIHFSSRHQSPRLRLLLRRRRPNRSQRLSQSLLPKSQNPSLSLHLRRQRLRQRH